MRTSITAYTEEHRISEDGTKFNFVRLSLKDVITKLKDAILADYICATDERFKEYYKVSKDEASYSDVESDGEDTKIYIEYTNGKKWSNYGIGSDKLKDLKISGIKNAIFEYPDVTEYFGKDCRIEKFDNQQDAPYVVKCEVKTMKPYSYNGQVITASSKDEAISKILDTKVYSYKNKPDKKLLDKSSQMIERFNRKFPRPDAKMYENYKGEINKDTLIQAWKDGRSARCSFTFEDFKPDNIEKKTKRGLEKFEKYVLPVYLDLVAGKTLKVYRGIHARPSNIKYRLLNLLKENSWSFDSRVAQAYSKSSFANKKDHIHFILIRECKLQDTNIMMSAFNEGYWFEYGSNAMGGANDEIVLNKSFNIGKVKIYPLDDSSKQQLIDLGYSSRLTDSL